MADPMKRSPTLRAVLGVLNNETALLGYAKARLLRDPEDENAVKAVHGQTKRLLGRLYNQVNVQEILEGELRRHHARGARCPRCLSVHEPSFAGIGLDEVGTIDGERLTWLILQGHSWDCQGCRGRGSNAAVAL